MPFKPVLYDSGNNKLHKDVQMPFKEIIVRTGMSFGALTVLRPNGKDESSYPPFLTLLVISLH